MRGGGGGVKVQIRIIKLLQPGYRSWCSDQAMDLMIWSSNCGTKKKFFSSPESLHRL